jgi:hypothetical protein
VFKGGYMIEEHPLVNEGFDFRDHIELELWRFRSIKDHDKALEAVEYYVDSILRSVKEMQ